MGFILNLTQHTATPEQIEAGVYEPAPSEKERIQKFLTFKELPTQFGIKSRAKSLARIAKDAGATHVLIGGAPYLMGALENALREEGIMAFYAFSKRVSTETTQPDGTTTKTTAFKHEGFIVVDDNPPCPEWTDPCERAEYAN